MADAVAKVLMDLARAVEALGRGLAELGERVAALEGRQAETERKHEAVQAASRSWKALMRIQADVMIASDAGETVRVPLSVLRPLVSGRPLDLDAREVAGDTIELLDARGRVVVRLPRAALLALPKLAASPEVARVLGSRTASQGVASRSCTPATVATRRADPPSSRTDAATGPGSRGCRPATCSGGRDGQEG